jgi:hypothetical protein
MTLDEREFELENVKFLARERDAINRIYYGLWIMFLGGFVLSLHVSIVRCPRTACVLIAVFRVLAIVGTAVNFLMQDFAIRFLAGIRERFFYRAWNAPRFVKEANVKIRLYGPRARSCETPLRVIAVLFLLIALVGSFLVRVS